MLSEYTTLLAAFARLFSGRVWQHAQIRLLGAILAPGWRMVIAVLGSVVLGLGDTVECRWGAKIKDKCIYWNPVRFSLSHFMKASDLSWLSSILLSPIPRAKRV